jgi:hypothetical protein
VSLEHRDLRLSQRTNKSSIKRIEKLIPPEYNYINQAFQSDMIQVKKGDLVFLGLI